MPFIPTDEPWAEFYRNMFPGHVRPRSPFAAWKYASTAVNVASNLWQARERARRRYEATHGKNPDSWPIAHPPLILWMPDAYDPACLRCAWTARSPGGAAGAGLAARQHSLQHGGDPLRLANSTVQVEGRGLPGDPQPPVASA
jgi:hypothetical protein